MYQVMFHLTQVFLNLDFVWKIIEWASNYNLFWKTHPTPFIKKILGESDNGKLVINSPKTHKGVPIQEKILNILQSNRSPKLRNTVPWESKCVYGISDSCQRTEIQIPVCHWNLCTQLQVVVKIESNFDFRRISFLVFIT